MYLHSQFNLDFFQRKRHYYNVLFANSFTVFSEDFTVRHTHLILYFPHLFDAVENTFRHCQVQPRWADIGLPPHLPQVHIRGDLFSESRFGLFQTYFHGVCGVNPVDTSKMSESLSLWRVSMLLVDLLALVPLWHSWLTVSVCSPLSLWLWHCGISQNDTNSACPSMYHVTIQSYCFITWREDSGIIEPLRPGLPEKRGGFIQLQDGDL